MCSTRKKHFLAILLCFCSCSGAGGGCVHPRDPAPGPLAEPGVSSQRLELLGLLVLCPLACGRSARWTPPRLPSPGPRRSSPGDRNMPRVLLLALYSSASLSFHDPWEPLLRASSFIQTQLLVWAPRTPAPQLGLGGALPAIRQGPAPPPSSLSPFSRPPGLREALALPFSDPPPSKLGLDSASPRALSRLPFTAAKL